MQIALKTMMKKMITANPVMIGLALMLLISCGTGADPAADANEMCKCFEQAHTDSRKYLECATNNEKMRQKYMDDNDALTRYDKLLIDCISGPMAN